MRSSAAVRARRVNVFALKGMWMSEKSWGATFTLKSWHTKRSDALSSLLVCDRRFSRVRSVRQNLRKAADGIVVMAHLVPEMCFCGYWKYKVGKRQSSRAKEIASSTRNTNIEWRVFRTVNTISKRSQQHCIDAERGYVGVGGGYGSPQGLRQQSGN